MNAEYFNRIVAVYGIGVDEFLELFASQGHRCAICQHDLVLFSSTRAEKPVVDHDHVTGSVRGILCHPCNVAVGWLEKDRHRTMRAAGYIEGFRSGAGSEPPPQSEDWNSAQWRVWRKKTRGLARESSEMAKVLARAAGGLLGKGKK